MTAGWSARWMPLVGVGGPNGDFGGEAVVTLPLVRVHDEPVVAAPDPGSELTCAGGM